MIDSAFIAIQQAPKFGEGFIDSGAVFSGPRERVVQGGDRDAEARRLPSAP